LNYAIVFVSNMSRSVSFYRDALGLSLRFESPQWTEFATEGATLALHAGAASPGKPADPHQTTAGVCRPGFSVRQLDDFHQRALARGVRCIQEPKKVFGARVALYADPDGMTISIGEHP
jgi:lactoylglutathione lyase